MLKIFLRSTMWADDDDCWCQQGDHDCWCQVWTPHRVMFACAHAHCGWPIGVGHCVQQCLFDCLFRVKMSLGNAGSPTVWCLHVHMHIVDGPLESTIVCCNAYVTVCFTENEMSSHWAMSCHWAIRFCNHCIEARIEKQTIWRWQSFYKLPGDSIQHSVIQHLDSLLSHQTAACI